MWDDKKRKREDGREKPEKKPDPGSSEKRSRVDT